jgi:serine/threonine protein kinase
LAPEILDSFTYSENSDIYSCGLCLWEVLHRGEALFGFIGSNDDFFKKLQQKSIDYSPLLEGDTIPSELQKTLVSAPPHFRYSLSPLIIILCRYRKNVGHWTRATGQLLMISLIRSTS